MDDTLYSQETIDKYMKENLFFNDPILKKYYEEDKVKEFRKRLLNKHSTKDLQDMVYAYVTDSIRDIIYEIIGKLSVYLKKSGDLILTGGDAVNYYLLLEDKVVTSDIDTKFVPRFQVDNKLFAKLQAVKLLLWNKLGEISKKYSDKIKKRVQSQSKLARFLGISFASSGPYVTRRYTLKQKKKISQTSQASLENILIDVEIFALDLKIKYFSIENKKVMKNNLGGILDIAFMRPDEFGYEVGEAKNSHGIIFRNSKGKLSVNPNITIAKRRFLIEDIYLMQALGLRPHKKMKDKQRIIKLIKTYPELRSLKKTGSISAIFSKYQKSPIGKTKKKIIPRDGKVSIQMASKINPEKYKNYTTQPSKEKLKKMVYASQNKQNGYKETKSNMRFNVMTNKWVKNNRDEYIKNEYKYRYNKNNKSLIVPKIPELYGFKKNRNSWAPPTLINKSSIIPFVGLKK